MIEFLGMSVTRKLVDSECRQLECRVMISVQKQIMPVPMGPLSVVTVLGGLFGLCSGMLNLVAVTH